MPHETVHGTYCIPPSVLQAATTQQVREKATLEEEASSQRRLAEDGSRTATELQQRLNSQSALVASLQDQAQNLQAALQQAHDQLGLQGKQSEEVKCVFERICFLGEGQYEN